MNYLEFDYFVEHFYASVQISKGDDRLRYYSGHRFGPIEPKQPISMQPDHSYVHRHLIWNEIKEINMT